MNFRNIGFSLAAMAAISPSISNAAPESASLAACAQAFAAKMANPGAPAPRYRVSYLNDASAGTLSLIYSREYTFELHAKDPKSGLVVSKATCSASREGVVTELTVMPVSASAPQFASRF